MDNNDQSHNDQFNASLPIPDNDAVKTGNPTNPAADLVRKKVESAYAHEPSAQAEAHDLVRGGAHTHLSAHQQFLYNLTTSGKPLHEIQTTWHEYYAGLPDDQ